MENTLVKQSLYNIRQDHYELIQMIEEADGELTPEIEQALQLNQEDFNNKAVSYGYVVKGFEDTEEVVEREIARLLQIKERVCKRKELFKTILSEAMQEYGVEKIETPTLKLSFRKSEAVDLTAEGEIPLDYFDTKVTVSVSKTKIKEALKAGKEVPGAQLVTRKNLQIR